MSRSPQSQSPPPPAVEVKCSWGMHVGAPRDRIYESQTGTAHGASFGLVDGTLVCHAVTDPVVVVVGREEAVAAVFVGKKMLPTVAGRLQWAQWFPASGGCALAYTKGVESVPWCDIWGVPRGPYIAAVYHHRLAGVLLCSHCQAEFTNVADWRRHIGLEGTDVLHQLINGRLYRRKLHLSALVPVDPTSKLSSNELEKACRSLKRRRVSDSVLSRI